MSEAVDKIISELERAGYKITPPPPPPPKLFCYKCGIAEENTLWRSLQDIRIVTCLGEEGFSGVLQLLCDSCFEEIANGLVALGLVSHRHGTTSSLEDRNCPGYHNVYDCPTPSEYEDEAKVWNY